MTKYAINTRAIHAGQSPEPITGAVMTPIFQTSTYAQSFPGKGEWEYSRTHNPTRTALQNCIASLEDGEYGVVFSSGLGAIDAIIRLLNPGDLVVCGDDVYGGTHRLFTQDWSRYGIRFHFVDTADPNLVIPADAAMVWVETPTNPLLKVTDISAVSLLATKIGALLVVDNTFATPIFQKPLNMGADIVIHSMTKYLNGHSDVIGGVAITNNDNIAEQLCWIQNSVGAVPGPQDCFLVLRGLKTLHIRMERHQSNAQKIVSWLDQHPLVKEVMYPGFSGMVSFILDANLDVATKFVTTTKLFILAESLGGVESLIELPAIMTHSSVPADIRKSIGIEDGLIRLSVGIEDVNDLLDDLKIAMKVAFSSL